MTIWMTRGLRRPGLLLGLLLGFLVGIIALMACTAPAEVEDSQEKLVVLLSLDTLRADRLGLYGAHPTPSPNLDALAERCTVFDNSSSAAPETYSTHSAIFWSLYPTFALQIAKDPDLRATFPSLIDVLNEAEVHTALFGQGPIRRVEATAAFGEQSFYDKSRDVLAAAVPWMAEAVGEPGDLFVFLHLYDIHAPYYESLDLIDQDYLMERDQALEWNRKRRELGLEAYDRGIEYVDHFLARLFTLLDTVDQKETLLIVTSDHGEGFGEHQDFYGHTHRLWQEIIGVPLVLCSSRDATPVRRPENVTSVDIAPTILDFLSLPLPDHFQGHTALSPVSTAEREFVLAEARKEIMIREGDIKLIFYREERQLELFDLASDPTESNNLAESDPDRARELLARVNAYYREQAAELGLEPLLRAGMRRHLVKKLKALGYVE